MEDKEETHLIYVFEDGDTWTMEPVTTVSVTDEQLSHIKDGGKVSDVVPDWDSPRRITSVEAVESGSAKEECLSCLGELITFLEGEGYDHCGTTGLVDKARKVYSKSKMTAMESADGLVTPVEKYLEAMVADDQNGWELSDFNPMPLTAMEEEEYRESFDRAWVRLQEHLGMSDDDVAALQERWKKPAVESTVEVVTPVEVEDSTDVLVEALDHLATCGSETNDYALCVHCGASHHMDEAHICVDPDKPLTAMESAQKYIDKDECVDIEGMKTELLCYSFKDVFEFEENFRHLTKAEKDIIGSQENFDRLLSTLRYGGES